MYEFNHHAGYVLHKGEFPYRVAEKFATHVFGECPKFLTLIRHADMDDDTPLHCVLVQRGVLDLHVPKQNFLLKVDEDGLRFVIIKVKLSPDESTLHWLIVRLFDRKGILVPYEVLDEKSGTLVAQIDSVCV